jgi:hypothetical protein
MTMQSPMPIKEVVICKLAMVGVSLFVRWEGGTLRDLRSAPGNKCEILGAVDGGIA